MTPPELLPFQDSSGDPRAAGLEAPDRRETPGPPDAAEPSRPVVGFSRVRAAVVFALGSATHLDVWNRRRRC